MSGRRESLARVLGAAVLELSLIVGAWRQRASAAARRELFSLLEGVEPGQPVASILDRCASRRRTYVECYRGLPKYVSLSTPIEFGATNWVAYVDVAADVIVAIRVRTEGSIHERPDGSPQDEP